MTRYWIEGRSTLNGEIVFWVLMGTDRGPKILTVCDTAQEAEDYLRLLANSA